jgi:exodeoxyribonuclease VII large subunit
MSRRALEQQGAGRAMSVVERSIGRRLQRVDEQEFRIRERVRGLIDRQHRIFRSLDSRLRYYDPRPRFARDRRRLDAAYTATAQAVRLQIAHWEARVQTAMAKLSQLSPLRILDRGYAIVTTQSGEIIKSSRMAPPGSAIHIRLAAGSLDAKVTHSE